MIVPSLVFVEVPALKVVSILGASTIQLLDPRIPTLGICSDHGRHFLWVSAGMLRHDGVTKSVLYHPIICGKTV